MYWSLTLWFIVIDTFNQLSKANDISFPQSRPLSDLDSALREFRTTTAASRENISNSRQNKKQTNKKIRQTKNLSKSRTDLSIASVRASLASRWVETSLGNVSRIFQMLSLSLTRPPSPPSRLPPWSSSCSSDLLLLCREELLHLQLQQLGGKRWVRLEW